MSACFKNVILTELTLELQRLNLLTPRHWPAPTAFRGPLLSVGKTALPFQGLSHSPLVHFLRRVTHVRCGKPCEITAFVRLKLNKY